MSDSLICVAEIDTEWDGVTIESRSSELTRTMLGIC